MDLNSKIEQINTLMAEVRKYKLEHPESRLGYSHNYGSLLNAYREGDIDFDNCVQMLGNCKMDETTKRILNETAEEVTHQILSPPFPPEREPLPKLIDLKDFDVEPIDLSDYWWTSPHKNDLIGLAGEIPDDHGNVAWACLRILAQRLADALRLSQGEVAMLRGREQLAIEMCASATEPKLEARNLRKEITELKRQLVLIRAAAMPVETVSVANPLEAIHHETLMQALVDLQRIKSAELPHLQHRLSGKGTPFEDMIREARELAGDPILNNIDRGVLKKILNRLADTIASAVDAHEQTKRELKSAWTNRDHFCHWINEIGRLFWGNNKDHYAPDAIFRKVRASIHTWIPIDEFPFGADAKGKFFFWLEWAEGCGGTQVLSREEQLFYGRYKCWGSLYKATHWMMPLNPPAGETDALH